MQWVGDRWLMDRAMLRSGGCNLRTLCEMRHIRLLQGLNNVPRPAVSAMDDAARHGRVIRTMDVHVGCAGWTCVVDMHNGYL